jgi:hypothetical protein
MSSFVVNLICLVVGYLCGFRCLFGHIITRLVIKKEIIRVVGNNQPWRLHVFNMPVSSGAFFTGILDGLMASYSHADSPPVVL